MIEYEKIEEAIFPLITYNPNTHRWKCLGTGFFINPYGGFVTAKHVILDNQNKPEATLYAVQLTSLKEAHLRPIIEFAMNPNADIGVGFLGKRRLADGSNVEPEISIAFQLSFKNLNKGDETKTFAYPLTITEETEVGYQFTFNGKWSEGKITDIHERTAVIKNKCYQTTMKIKSGASGGPVLKNNCVIGINSSSFDGVEGDPISFFTPIELILDLKVGNSGDKISIRELIEKGQIKEATEC